jgi:hypothetical protein
MIHGRVNLSFILRTLQRALTIIFSLYSRGVHLSLPLPLPVLIHPYLNYTPSHHRAHQNRTQTASPDRLSSLTLLPEMLCGERTEDHGGPRQHVAGGKEVGE